MVSVRLQFTLYMFMQRKLIAMTHEVAYTKVPTMTASGDVHSTMPK